MGQDLAVLPPDHAPHTVHRYEFIGKDNEVDQG